MDKVDDLAISCASSDKITLLRLLSNPLFLYQTAPYLPPYSLLALGATSKPFRDLIHHTRGVFRYLDLTNVNSVQFDIASIDHGGEVWRNVQLDENVTEDDFYAGPLRGVFSGLKRRHILQDVQTLILDGLSVTSELITEIILNDSFNVRLLSIREVKNLNQRKLMQALQYAVRPGRAENTPRLQALYVFGPKDGASSSLKLAATTSSMESSLSRGMTSSRGAQIGAQLNHKSAREVSKALAQNGDNWYDRFGEVFPSRAIQGWVAWAETLLACKGIINFDTIVCTGPRHHFPLPRGKGEAPPAWYQTTDSYILPAVATVALEGCTVCHSAPEGMSYPGTTPTEALPVLTPPPLHCSTLRAATRPITIPREEPTRMLARCTDCLKGRYCQSCRKWWCEDCYEGSRMAQKSRIGAWRDCYECGFNCYECVAATQQRCKICGGGYCVIHNEGSTLTTAGRHAIDGCRC